MSVALTVQIPSPLAQFVGLGGDGFTAPFSMNQVVASLTSDAGGGVNSIRIICDPRYAVMVLSISAQVVSASASRVALLEVDGTGAISRYTRTMVNDTSFTPSSAVTWSPPPAVLLANPLGAWVDATNPDGDPEIRVTIDNVDVTEILTVFAVILNFNIEAPHRVPYNILINNYAPCSQP